MTDEQLAAVLPAFFEDKGITPTCESCGHNEWQVATDAAPFIVSSAGRKSKIYDTHMIICKNCGFVRYYYSDVVEKWSKEKGSA